MTGPCDKQLVPCGQNDYNPNIKDTVKPNECTNLNECAYGCWRLCLHVCTYVPSPALTCNVSTRVVKVSTDVYRGSAKSKGVSRFPPSPE